MINRQEEIRSKGFNLTGTTRDYLEYNKLKVGTKTIDDAILNIGSLKRTRIK